ncbi:hypothetical protein L596_010011 [Steinernema carpocapsae]|uniref:Uncharacterized protein n=1 Tax=Steinernema carpocapsae TaxID=34508 RepID=A0A4U5PHI9_STECR|nr:hypothetical protein L596_010011 [Steinernema carpocapsae]
MFKPKLKMLQKVSPSMLSPLFERGRLKPTIPAARRFHHRTQLYSPAVVPSLSLSQSGSLKYYPSSTKQARSSPI